MSPNTEYRPWPRAPRYLVGSDGSIIGPRGRPLVLCPVGDHGYLAFSFWEDGRGRNGVVHVVVCETFHGPRPPGKWAAHHDGDKSNCSADNLGWKTYTENEADKVRHGRTVDGERNGSHILTLAQVREIRASHESAVALALRYPVTARAIRDVRNGHTWQRAR